MSVTVDHEPLATAMLGLDTVGEVLSHLARANRLVVQLLIDGYPPDVEQLASVRQSPVDQHTLYIETADPREMALEVLRDAQADLAIADSAREDAADLLRRGQFSAAMEKLSVCISAWQQAHQAVMGTAQLHRIDGLDVIMAAKLPQDWLETFAEQLRQFGAGVTARDQVALVDLLVYEATNTTSQWQAAIDAVRRMI